MNDLRNILKESVQESGVKFKLELIDHDDSILFGKDSAFDSLSFVSFVVIVEEKIAERFEKPITIVDEKALSQRQSPFRTVGSFIGYLEEKLK